MKKGGVAYALWKLDCYLVYWYVEVNLLNGTRVDETVKPPP